MFGRFSKKKKTEKATDEKLDGFAYVIGDIHGCFDELVELLDLIKQDAALQPSGPKYVVFLGDLMDRGPKSKEVIEHLLSYKSDFATPVFLMGNHEEVFLKVLSGSQGALASWFEFGGRSCVRSYGVENLGEILINPENVLFRIQEKVRVPIEKQTTKDLRWIRNEFIKYTKPHPFIIVHGHTIVETAQVLSNRIPVDTGTYEGGPLTAVRLGADGAHFIQTASKA